MVGFFGELILMGFLLGGLFQGGMWEHVGGFGRDLVGIWGEFGVGLT